MQYKFVLYIFPKMNHQTPYITVQNTKSIGSWPRYLINWLNDFIMNSYYNRSVIITSINSLGWLATWVEFTAILDKYIFNNTFTSPVLARARCKVHFNVCNTHSQLHNSLTCLSHKIVYGRTFVDGKIIYIFQNWSSFNANYKYLQVRVLNI